MKWLNIRPTDVIVIAGKRGGGKTTLAKILLAQSIPYKRLVVFDVMKQYAGMGLVCKNSTDLRLAMQYREPRIIFQPVNVSIDASELMFLLAYTYRDYFLVIEEADRIAYTHFIGKNHSQILDLGRHHGNGLMELSRKVNRLHSLPSSQATHFFIFKTFLPADIKYLEDFLPPTLAESIKGLSLHECAYYNSETEETRLFMVEKGK